MRPALPLQSNRGCLFLVLQADRHRGKCRSCGICPDPRDSFRRTISAPARRWCWCHLLKSLLHQIHSWNETPGCSRRSCRSSTRRSRNPRPQNSGMPSVLPPVFSTQTFSRTHHTGSHTAHTADPPGTGSGRSYTDGSHGHNSARRTAPESSRMQKCRILLRKTPLLHRKY